MVPELHSKKVGRTKYSADLTHARRLGQGDKVKTQRQRCDTTIGIA